MFNDVTLTSAIVNMLSFVFCFHSGFYWTTKGLTWSLITVTTEHDNNNKKVIVVLLCAPAANINHLSRITFCSNSIKRNKRTKRDSAHTYTHTQ